MSAVQMTEQDLFGAIQQAMANRAGEPDSQDLDLRYACGMWTSRPMRRCWPAACVTSTATPVAIAILPTPPVATSGVGLATGVSGGEPPQRPGIRQRLPLRR